MKHAVALCLGLAAAPVWASDAEEAFVEANILGIFYHEFGHALIDVMQVPLFGQEEDAADVASILLIDQFYEPEVALQMAYDVSDGFWAEAQANMEEPVPYWDVHGPDEQRFYNTVCLFYGGNPDGRDDFASDMALPEERAEYCPDEYAVASESWGLVLDDLTQDGTPLAFQAEDADTLTARLMKAEVDALNGEFAFPTEVHVRAEPCGEANAFYDPSDQSITMCEEFEAHLRKLFALLNQ